MLAAGSPAGTGFAQSEPPVLPSATLAALQSNSNVAPSGGLVLKRSDVCSHRIVWGEAQEEQVPWCNG